MSRSVNIDPSTYWDQGWYPQMTLWAYTVGHDSSGYRTLTRASAYDISPDYIEHGSIRYESQSTPGDKLEPGGVVPAHLTFNLLPGCSVAASLEATPGAESTYGYERVYEVIVMFTNGSSSGSIYRLGGRFVVTEKSNTRNTDKIKIAMDEEFFIFDNFSYDLASKTSLTYRNVIGNIFAEAGFRPSDVYDTSNIVNGGNYYTGEPMSARQALSYILQLNGCFLFMQGQYFYVRWLANESISGVWPAKYSGDYSWGDHSGNYTQPVLFPSNQAAATGNYPWGYVVKGNPLLISANVPSYKTVLQDRVCGRTHRGLVINYMFDPTLEPGDDMLEIDVMYDPYTTEPIQHFLITRFEWDGGLYCKLSEAVYNPVNRA